MGYLGVHTSLSRCSSYGFAHRPALYSFHVMACYGCMYFIASRALAPCLILSSPEGKVRNDSFPSDFSFDYNTPVQFNMFPILKSTSESLAIVQLVQLGFSLYNFAI